jgi:hypothetical protein
MASLPSLLLLLSQLQLLPLLLQVQLQLLAATQIAAFVRLGRHYLQRDKLTPLVTVAPTLV